MGLVKILVELDQHLRKLRVVFAPQTRPVNRFESTHALEIPRIVFWVPLLITAGYSAIFLSGWYFIFPTRIEQTLWRAASATTFANVGASTAD